MAVEDIFLSMFLSFVELLVNRATVYTCLFFLRNFVSIDILCLLNVSTEFSLQTTPSTAISAVWFFG